LNQIGWCGWLPHACRSRHDSDGVRNCAGRKTMLRTPPKLGSLAWWRLALQDMRLGEPEGYG
jgi:hypothetical protein